LGYFVPFLDVQRGEALLSGITAGSVPDLKMRLGIPASGVGGYHPLRCCKECIENDKRTLGWPIWHLAHQAPSALVCLWHKRPLVQTWHPISPVHRREWLLPNASKASDRYEISLPDEQALGLLFQLAELSEHVFGVEPGVWNPVTLSAVYRRWAHEHSAVTKAGSLRHSVLESELAPRFNQLRGAFRALSPMPIDLQLGSMIGAVIRTTPKPIHPLKHLVLLIAMFGDVNTTRAALNLKEIDYASLNTAEASTSEDDPMVNQNAERLTIFLASIEQGQSISTAAISAGVSTSTGVRWARQHGVVFTPRPKVMNATVLENIRDDLRRGLDRPVVAATHDVSVVSINRLLSTEHGLRDTWHNARHEAARISNRASLISLIRDQPTISSSQLRKTPGSGWTWLYRHDRAWLEATLPSLWNHPPDHPENT
jgi:hypothetical protein